MEQEDFIVNEHGLRIVKCCAACVHKEYTGSEDYRKCKLHQIDIRPSDVCSSFSILPSCMKEGGTQGRIRKKHYIDYLTERLADPDVPGERKKTPFTIEQEYTAKFGSPYVDL